VALIILIVSKALRLRRRYRIDAGKDLIVVAAVDADLLSVISVIVVQKQCKCK